MQENIRRILERNISPYFLKIYQPYIDRAITETGNNSLAGYITTRITNIITDSVELAQYLNQEEKDYASANNIEKKKIILRLSAMLGSSKKELYEDENAYDTRWFDFSAIQERFLTCISNNEKEICFLLRQYQYAITKDQKGAGFLVKILREQGANQEIVLAALYSLTGLLHAAIIELPQEFIQDISDIIDQQDNIWIVAKYLEIFAILNQKKFIHYFKKLFQDYNLWPKKEAIFLKVALIELLQYLLEDIKPLIELAQKDNSAYVRQAVCRYLKMDSLDSGYIMDILKDFILSDIDPAVQYCALMIFTEKIIQEQNINEFLELAEGIVNSTQTCLFQTLLNSFKNLVQGYIASSSTISPKQYKQILGLINKIINSETTSLIAKKQGCDVRLEICIISDKKLSSCRNKLQNFITNLPETNIVTITDYEVNSLNLEEIGKILYLISDNDFDLEFWQHQGYYVIKRGVETKPKLWRFLHEMLHPNTGKRQAYSHIRAKAYEGEHLVLSNMAELSNTGVPGEQLYLPYEGVRRFLPLLDYCLAIIKRKSERYIFSAEGITIITPPVNFINKIYAYLKLSLNFKLMSDLKNLPMAEHSLQLNSYVNKLQQVGIDIKFTEDKDNEAIPETKRFFASLGIIPFFDHSEIWEYFASPHENNIYSLIIFLSLLVIMLGCSRIYKYKSFIDIRNTIPLVIGGWGTRGKTSMERLKAALFSSLGFNIVTKTTGSNASIIVTDAKQRIYELPLIRPYNTHTIAEQKELTKFAAGYKAEIFLWECMGLNPEYTKIMQMDWMKDDISTITNSYPDHEEIQGPTGLDVTSSISSFIHKETLILTAEEQMLPIFKERARQEHALLEQVAYDDINLITKDILELFSYHEHPNNIALTLLLAGKLSINKNVALKNITDNVRPDIGALKILTPCKISGRTLYFINGMSANEVVGSVNNWHRLGFDDITLESDPCTYICALVNNRDDRVKRSKDFAVSMVNIFSVDKYFLIGSNLTGFKKIILKEWQKYLNHMTDLMERSGDKKEILEKLACKLRICRNVREKNKITEAIKLFNEPNIVQSPVEFQNNIEQNYQAYCNFKKQVIEGNFKKNEIQEFFTMIFTSKIILIETPDNNVEKIIAEIVKNTPPGFTNRILGMQNIKSPGIDFIKLWQDYEICYDACENLKQYHNIKTQLDILLGFSQFNILSKEYVVGTIAELRTSGKLQQYNEQLEKIEITLAGDENHTPAASRHELLQNIMKELFALKDTFHNTITARQIYQDLIDKRISPARAEQELSKRL